MRSRPLGRGHSHQLRCDDHEADQADYDDNGHGLVLLGCCDSAAPEHVAGLDVAEVMQAGGRKTPTMVARYTEHLQARRGAMSKLAAKQDRL